MISKDMVNYIKAQIDKGQSKENIKKALADAGWQVADIDEAFKYAQSEIPLAPIPGNMQNMSQPGQAGQNTQFLASPTDLLKEAWGIYKARFKTFIIISLIPALVIVALLVALFIILFIFGLLASGGPISLIFPTAQAIITSPTSTFIEEPAFPSVISNIVNFILGFGIIVFVIIIPIIILQLWSQAALLFAIKDSEENIGVKESYRRGWKKIGSIFWVGLLSGIIVVGGYLLFVVPGIIFAVWFSLALYIVIAEGLGGMNAILKSKEYVRGYWWEVFWRFIFIGLVIIGINIAVMLLGLVIPVLPNLLMIFLTPLTVIYTFLVYKNLKAIKEAKGEVKSEFSSGEKIKYILAGLAGIILVFGFIFGSIVLVSLNSARGKAMDTSRQASMYSLRTPLALYADDHNGLYPSSLQQLITEKEMYSNSSYLDTIPVDPKTKFPFEYRQLKAGKDFELCAILDSGAKKCINAF